MPPRRYGRRRRASYRPKSRRFRIPRNPSIYPRTRRSTLSIEHKYFDVSWHGEEGADLVGGAQFNSNPNSIFSLTCGTISGANGGLAAASALTAGAALASVTGTPLVGAGINQRIGKKFAWQSIQIRGAVYAGSLALNTSGSNTITSQLKGCTNNCMCLVWDREPNKSAVGTIADILTAGSGGLVGSAPTAGNELVTSAITAASLTNRDNAPRFKIVKRWDFCMGPIKAAGGTGAGVGHVCFDEVVKFKPYKYISQFTSDASATSNNHSNLIKGDFLLFAIGDCPLGATASFGYAPTGNFNLRVNYTDT